MTIDEVITNKKNKIKEWEEELYLTPSNDITHITHVKEIIKSYEQEIEWLNELKELREKDQKLMHLTQKEFNVGTKYTYNKAIDEFVEMTKKANIDNYNYPSSCILTIEKLLKAGGKNE